MSLLICSLLLCAVAEKGIFLSWSQVNLATLLEEPSPEFLLGEDEDATPPKPTEQPPRVHYELLAFATLSLAALLRQLRPSPSPAAPLAPPSAEATDVFGCTALHVAAAKGTALEARKLLEGGALVDAREAWEETPLHMAARNGNLPVARILTTHGADVNAKNLDDVTPLVIAAKEGQQELCRFLLELGAGAGGLAEDKLPCLLNTLLMQRLLKEGKVA